MKDESKLEDKDEDQDDEKSVFDEPVNELKVQDDHNSVKESVVEDENVMLSKSYKVGE